VTAISRQLADTLGLDLGQAAGLVGLSQGVPARAATLHALGLGDFTRADVPCFVLDLGELRTSLGVPVEGILGFSALNRYAVTFDFARGALELAENAPLHVPGTGGARLPLDLLGGVVTIDGRVDGGEPIPFLLDTGSPRTFVPTRIGRSLAGATARRPSHTSFLGADGRALEATEVHARSLALGNVRLTWQALLFMPGDHAQDPIGLTLGSGDRGVLGADVLTRFRVTLDYPRKEVVLEPR